MYIGITSAPRSRFGDHTRAGSLVGRAIRKYGKENFDMQILVESHDQYIVDLEAPAILAYQTLHPAGYNLSLQTQTSFKHHELSKEKMRKPKSDEARKNMSIAKVGKPSGRKGILHSEETKIKMRKPKSLEGKQNIAEGAKKRPPVSEEARQNRASARIGIHYPIVTCPHCGKEGGSSSMPRWHFDRCKNKDKPND